jgi:hypothetical protein
MDIPLEEKSPEMEQEKSEYGNLTKETFYHSIEEIVKIEPLTPRDGATYVFKFCFGEQKGSIELDVSDFLKGYRKFEELLVSHFNIPLPPKIKAKQVDPYKASEWTKFVRICTSTCRSVPPEESTEWAEIDRFLDKVAGFNVMEESQKQEWGANSGTAFNLLKTND